MPLYNYACNNCEHEFEGLYKFEDDVPCPECGAMSTQKLPTCASFKIRGFREANGYGTGFIDMPGKNPDTGDEVGHTFSSKGGRAKDTHHGNTER